MADRYWVGGSGNWSDTNRWSTASGGGGGASVPGVGDNAYFDGSSDTGAPFTVTVDVNATCKDFIVGDGTTITTLDQAMTLTSSGTISLSVYGSWFNPATNYSSTFTRPINFLGAGSFTITTNGVTLGLAGTNVGFNNTAGTWTLLSSLTCAAIQFHINGTFNTNGYNLTCGAYAFNVIIVNTATVNFGASTITLTAPAGINSGNANTVINAGTSKIILSASSPTIQDLPPTTFYDVEVTATALTQLRFTGQFTYNNLTIASRAATGIGSWSISGSQTILGTLTIQSANTDRLRRFLLSSSVPGTARTVTAAAVSLGTGIDCRDITAAGGGGTWDLSAKSGGDCGGNTNITFPVAKTVYRKGTGNWSATQWASTSAGSPAADQFPLAQDTAIFGANTTAGTHTIDAGWQIGALDMTNSTAVTLAAGTTTPTFHDDLTFSANVTPTGTGLFTFAPKSGVTLDITTAGKTVDNPITFAAAGTVKLADNLTTGSARTTTLTGGTLDLNGKTLTTGLFNSNNANTRTLAFGAGKIVTKGTGTVWTTSTVTGLTVTGTPVVDIDNNTATAVTVTTGALAEANSINFNYINGTYTLTDTAAVYRNLNFTGFGGTVPNSVRTLYGSLTLASGATNSAGTNTTTFAATSGTQQITTNAVTVNYPLTFNGVGGTFAFQDALTQGTTRAFTITNGTVQLKAGTTNVVGSFVTSGTNQKYLQSTTSGTQATISDASGVNSVSYLTIQDSVATGGATWNAFYSNGNIDAGNNLNWDFGETPVLGTEYEYKLRSFTEPRRF